MCVWAFLTEYRAPSYIIPEEVPALELVRRSTQEWVMAHTAMRHVTHSMSHIQMMRLCHTYKWWGHAQQCVMSQIADGYVTHTYRSHMHAMHEFCDMTHSFVAHIFFVFVTWRKSKGCHRGMCHVTSATTCIPLWMRPWKMIPHFLKRRVFGRGMQSCHTAKCHVTFATQRNAFCYRYDPISYKRKCLCNTR